MGQSFELTKEGIKLSYLRFLSDSAGGFVVLLLLVFAYWKRLPLPGKSHLNANPIEMGAQLKVFLLVLSFLIATPLGLMLNGASFFLLGASSSWLVDFWGRLGEKNLFRFLIVRTRRKYHAEETARFFRLQPWRKFPAPRPEPESGPEHQNGERSLFDTAHYYNGLLSFYFPSYVAQSEHLRGLSNFVCSLAFLSLVVSPYCFFCLPENPKLVTGLALAGSLLLLLYNSLLEYYQWLKTLFMTYALSSDLHSSNPTRKQIVENLIELSEKLRTS